MTDEPAPTPEACPRCRGLGYDPDIPWPCSNVCDACGGDGRVHGPGDHRGPGGES